MASLLYVCVRPELGAADAEYASFRRGLGVSELDRIDLVTSPLTDEVLRRYRGFVVGGSPLNVTDTDKSAVQVRVERDLERIAQHAIDTKAAAFFTCFGIGVVTRMLGGAVTDERPEAASATTVSLTDLAEDDPVFGPSTPSLHVFTAHKESAVAVPPGADLLATNTASPVQAYRVGSHLYATQFHPETTPQDFAERMTYYRSKGYFDPEAFDEVRGEVLAAPVVDATALLRRFAETFAVSAVA